MRAAKPWCAVIRTRAVRLAVLSDAALIRNTGCGRCALTAASLRSPHWTVRLPVVAKKYITVTIMTVNVASAYPDAIVTGANS